MRVRFTREFMWRPKAAVTIVYHAGLELQVPRKCAEAAIAAGAAIDPKLSQEDLRQ